jgi:hypothetical protein
MVPNDRFTDIEKVVTRQNTKGESSNEDSEYDRYETQLSSTSIREITFSKEIMEMLKSSNKDVLKVFYELGPYHSPSIAAEVFVTPEGYIYEGQLLDDKRQGVGRLITPTNIYCGEWNDDQATGKGVLKDLEAD